MKLKMVVAGVCLALLSGCQTQQAEEIPFEEPVFKNVSVHDPSIIKDSEGEYFIIGSHMQAAKSSDLIQWQQISTDVPTTKLFEDVHEEFKDEFAYAQTGTFWAGDVIQLKDGKYYMYYCLCRGDSPLSVLGVAVADQVDGPYKKVESFLYSGTSPQFGKTYDATKDPNAIDPHVFYGHDEKLWMVYGSYSGGIYILELDDTTGLPKDRTSYGKKLMGGNHSRIEAPYITYNPETKYYYLFVTFGGLDSQGGYNMRVSRSKNADGPYEDISGQEMIQAKGKVNSFFDDPSIEKYGNKLMGNFIYKLDEPLTNKGYVSPGHNSVYYDEAKNEYYLVFHTRFPNRGEGYGVRVHQMYFTESGWPVVSPLRYAGETFKNPAKKEIAGNYKLIQTTKKISKEVSLPELIELKRNGKIEGTHTGKWQLAKNPEEDSKVTINESDYFGKFIYMWDETQKKQVMSFTGVNDEGIPIYLVEEISGD